MADHQTADSKPELQVMNSETGELAGEFRRQYEAAVEAEANINVKINELQDLIWNIRQIYERKENRYPIRGMLYRRLGWDWLIIRSHIREKMRVLRNDADIAHQKVLQYQSRAGWELS